MSTIEEKFSILLEKISGLETKLDENRRFQEKEITEIKSHVNELASNIQSYREREENNSRKKNIVIFGLDTEKIIDMNNTVLEILHYITTDLRPYDITEIRKMNYKNKNGPILVKLNSILLKRDIMKNKFRLMNSEVFKMIKIKDDMPKAIRDIRKELFPFMKALGKKSSMRYDKLLIEGKLYTLEDLKILEEQRNKKGRSEESSPEVKEIRDNTKFKPPGHKVLKKGKRKKPPQRSHSLHKLDKYISPKLKVGEDINKVDAGPETEAGGSGQWSVGK